MPTPFERTWRVLDTDTAGLRTLSIVFISVLLAGWLLWFINGDVKVYEVSRKTNLEAEIAAHSIATRISGRVLVAHLELGRRVKTGDVLIELNADAERLALTHAETELQGLKAQQAALRPEIKARQTGLTAHRLATGLASIESRAQADETKTQSQFADAQVATRRTLLAKNVVSVESFRELEAKAKASHASVRAHDANTARLQQEGEVAIADRHAVCAELERKLTELESAANSTATEINTIQQRIDTHYIRAAIDGRLGRVEMLHTGAVVQTGQVLGAIIPDGNLHAVAWFASSGLGRIQVGQTARLRLDGFPWTQYGTLAATVISVGNEPLADEVRVELDIQPKSAPDIPLGHGLTGTTEIEVEHASPLQLVLRAIGQQLTTRHTS
jgi:membrane fusion protein (multidrug efflux system)